MRKLRDVALFTLFAAVLANSSLADQFDNGVLKDTGQQTSIYVKLMRQNALATASPEEVVVFGKRLDNLRREGTGAEAAMNTLLVELGAIKQTQMRSGAADELRNKARGLELEVLDLQLQLSGDERRDLAGATGPVSVRQRTYVALMGTSFSTYGPTPIKAVWKSANRD